MKIWKCLCLPAILLSSVFFLSSCESPAGTYIGVYLKDSKTITETIKLYINNKCDQFKSMLNEDGSIETYIEPVCSWQRYIRSSPQVITDGVPNSMQYDTIVISIKHDTKPDTLQDTYYFYLFTALHLKRTERYFYKQ